MKVKALFTCIGLSFLAGALIIWRFVHEIFARRNNVLIDPDSFGGNNGGRDHSGIDDNITGLRESNDRIEERVDAIERTSGELGDTSVRIEEGIGVFESANDRLRRLIQRIREEGIE